MRLRPMRNCSNEVTWFARTYRIDCWSADANEALENADGGSGSHKWPSRTTTHVLAKAAPIISRNLVARTEKCGNFAIIGVPFRIQTICCFSNTRLRLKRGHSMATTGKSKGFERFAVDASLIVADANNRSRWLVSRRSRTTWR
jgi:hypothetical protein